MMTTRETEMASQTTEAITYTDHEATDEAVLLLVRKLRRLHPDTYKDLMNRIPEGARLALGSAERRAYLLREEDEKAGIKMCTREYPDPFADLEGEDGED